MFGVIVMIFSVMIFCVMIFCVMIFSVMIFCVMIFCKGTTHFIFVGGRFPYFVRIISPSSRCCPSIQCPI